MKLGIVGAGMIVHDVLSFLPQVKSIEITAICSRKSSYEKAKQLAEQARIPLVYEDLEAMLEDDKVDAIYIGVPNNQHFALAKMALLAKKHVLVEKPFTSNHQEALVLAALAKQQACILYEAVSTHHLPNMLHLKKDVSKLGEIRIVTLNYSQYSSRYDAFKQGIVAPAFDPKLSGGALMDLNIYNMDFVLNLFGEPMNVEYFANVQKGIDTSGILILEYPTFKCVCTGAKDCKAPLFNSIQGEKGSIIIQTSVSTLINYQLIMNDGSRQQSSANEGETFNYSEGNHRMYDVFVEFERIVREDDRAQAQKMLDLSVLSMKVQTEARMKAGIVFPADLQEVA